MEEIWELLWQLQELDLEHVKRLKERSNAPGDEERERLSQEVIDAGERLAKQQKSLAKRRHSFRQVELDLRSTEEHLTHDDARLYGGEVTNAKELAQLEHRVAEERENRSELEEKYLVLLEEIEQDEEKLAAAQALVESSQRSLTAFDEERAQNARRAEAQDREYESLRAAILQKLPDQNREKYERIHARHPGSTLVRIVRGSCGGCHNALARAEIERVTRMNGLSTCENCGRLLAPASVQA